jgi:hypothetical protein
MSRRTLLVPALLLVIAIPPAGLAAMAAEEKASEDVLIRDSHMVLRLDRQNGTLRAMSDPAGQNNQLAESREPFALWQLTIRDGDKTRILGADQAGPMQIEQLSGVQPGLRLTWNAIPSADKRPLRVEVTVRPDQAGQSRWEFSLSKPADLRVTEVAFPRVPRLKPRENAAIAAPEISGVLLKNAKALLAGPKGKGRRMAWTYPGTISMQFVAYYEPDGLGLYTASDDTRAYTKRFSLWGDAAGQTHFEAIHLPEQEAVGLETYRVPYAVILGSFRGDWSTAALLYRESAAAKTWARQGRLHRGLTPDWVTKTGAWAWNRGRSGQALEPATVLQKHLGAPVSLFWHWWHGCAYDAGFPEYLPPREGTESMRNAVEAAQRQGLHAIIYMNMRLWGTTTKSWIEEGAEAFAAKGQDGKIRTEVYNVFMNAPCAPMCLGTDFWRTKYADLACDAICNLKVDGIYMDQACSSHPPLCFNPSHGHILGHGRYLIDGFGLLSNTIRDRCSLQRRVVLGGEYCGEPWLPYLDLMLTWDLSHERISGNTEGRERIPLFQAVYHTSTLFFGSYGSLVHPPYDERWPADKAPAGQLTLLDRKFGQQFCLEQARLFAWGQQLTIPNFLPNLLTDRPQEIDFLKRSVQIRQQTLKYLQYGTWLRPPVFDIPQREIDLCKVGTYRKLVEWRNQVPLVIAGTWRAADGDVGIPLASIDDAPLVINLPIDAKAFGLADDTVVYRTDHTGRQRLGELRKLGPTLRLELPPRAVWMLEFCKTNNK